MSAEAIALTRTNDIVVVALNRPERRNAVTSAMWQALAEIFIDLAADDSLRGVILTGAGECFSAGADIADFAQNRATMQQGIVYEEAVDAACDAVEADLVAAAAARLAETAELAPLSIAGAKKILIMLAMQDRVFDPARADAANMRALTSGDYAEGRSALRNMRAPRFRGH
jgi:enoyl-CoA hydratase/carnithine racemase